MRHGTCLSREQLSRQQPSGGVGTKLPPKGAEEVEELEPVDASGCYKLLVGHCANQEEYKHPCEAHHLHHKTSSEIPAFNSYTCCCDWQTLPGKATHGDAHKMHLQLHLNRNCVKPECSKPHGYIV